MATSMVDTITVPFYFGLIRYLSTLCWSDPGVYTHVRHSGLAIWIPAGGAFGIASMNVVRFDRCVLSDNECARLTK